MDIIVCVKWVPDTSEAELTVDSEEREIEKDDLDFDINDWDRFAVEEAVQLKEKVGGKVTVVTIAPEEAEEMLRESLARGADEAFHLWDESIEGSDGYAIARILAKFIKDRPYDLVLTGTQAEDDCAGQLGGMLGAMLGVPSATLVHKIDVQDGKVGIVRELEGGISEALDMDLPAVISIDKGVSVQESEPIQEARYASLPGIMKAKKKEIKPFGLGDSGLSADDVGAGGAKVKVAAYEPLPERAAGKVFKEMETADAVKEVVKLLREEAKVI